jgi:hypothetical protein
LTYQSCVGILGPRAWVRLSSRFFCVNPLPEHLPDAQQPNQTLRNTNQSSNSNIEPEKQVKSKKRVTDHGEVFTAEREVNAMLDLVK